MRDQKKAKLLVLIQALLMLSIGLSPLIGDFNVKHSFNSLGVFLFVFGFLCLLYSIFSLGKSLEVSPIPNKAVGVHTDKAYRFARHPIYSAILLMSLGYTLYFSNILTMVLSLLLLILFYFKSSFEEELLIKKFGQEYLDYKKSVGRFTPLI